MQLGVCFLMTYFALSVQTLIYSGRPLRCRNTPYVKSWNVDRADEIEKLTSEGIVPFMNELKQSREKGTDFDVTEAIPLLMGQIAGWFTPLIARHLLYGFIP